jgi:hypothetical protein
LGVSSSGGGFHEVLSLTGAELRSPESCHGEEQSRLALYDEGYIIAVHTEEFPCLLCPLKPVPLPKISPCPTKTGERTHSLTTEDRK